MPNMCENIVVFGQQQYRPDAVYEYTQAVGHPCMPNPVFLETRAVDQPCIPSPVFLETRAVGHPCIPNIEDTQVKRTVGAHKKIPGDNRRRLKRRDLVDQVQYGRKENGVKRIAVSFQYKNKERPVYEIDHKVLHDFMEENCKHIKVPAQSDFNQHFISSRNQEWRTTQSGRTVPSVPYFHDCGLGRYACLTLECPPTPIPTKENLPSQANLEDWDWDEYA